MYPLTLLHSYWPKLIRVLASLNVICLRISHDTKFTLMCLEYAIKAPGTHSGSYLWIIDMNEICY